MRGLDDVGGDAVCWRNLARGIDLVDGDSVEYCSLSLRKSVVGWVSCELHWAE